uniref:Phenylalanyl-tRNA synthetase domain-containing protein n=1 Tax=Amphimedon queenslandica TaxID=400682 RepID=A0A1X7UHE2_AMPQE
MWSYCHNSALTVLKLEEAQKNILWTHTTAVSTRMLYKLGQQEFTPVKYFSIDCVFRNKTLDATHLAKFHLIEGVVADYNLTLGDLMGVLSIAMKYCKTHVNSKARRKLEAQRPQPNLNEKDTLLHDQMVMMSVPDSIFN